MGREDRNKGAPWRATKLKNYKVAERLASILSALGAEAEAKNYGKDWRVQLYTDSITAIRRPEWLEAVKALVEELQRCGVIDGGKSEYLLRELAAGPNVVEIAGVEMSVLVKKPANPSNW
ncbi:PaRep2b protein [Pyrobaculum sp.]|uniref:PaRep2b protein n=2 Tax=Pyrobaculum sp. TaxID=2004705 RepID=UPI003160AE5C